MKILKNLYLLISLSPFILVIYISSLNTNKYINFKLLVWEFQGQNISKLILLGSSLGFSLSALNIYLISARPTINKSRVKRTIKNAIDYEYNDNLLQEDNFDQEDLNQCYVERDIRDPSPTVSVPYRILKRRSGKPSDKSEEVRKDHLYEVLTKLIPLLS